MKLFDCLAGGHSVCLPGRRLSTAPPETAPSKTAPSTAFDCLAGGRHTAPSKLADALVTTLRDWGLEYVFGVGGANIEHLYDAVHRLGGGRFRLISAKSEVGAAFMADCRARVHRTLGVCCATSGGGMMNLAVGIAESFAESVPVLALVGQPPRSRHGRGAFQDSSGIGRTVNADRLWSAITKYQASITEPQRFWNCLDAAVRAALTGRPGPAALLIPRDLNDCDVGPRPAWLPRRLEDLLGPSERGPSDGASPAIGELFDAIRAAGSPVLLLGSGVDRSSDPAAVVEFARRAGLRVATTLSSKNTFPNDDPLYLGMVGVAGEPSVHRYLCEEADLIVAVGTGLNMMTAEPIRQALESKRLAVVNIELDDVLRVADPAVSVEADAGRAFSELNRLFDRFPLAPRAVTPVPVTRYLPQPAAELAAEPAAKEFDAEENNAQEFDAQEFDPPPDDRRGELLQSDALEILQGFLPKFGHVLFDAGNCAAAALHYLRIPAHVSTTVALGMGGMGYAVAAAVGAQLGSRRGSGTMVFCGDGAFLMLGTEVHTAVHYRLPILFVVFNNGMHGMCVTRQQLYFDGRLEGSRYPAISVAATARGLGSPDRLWVGSAATTEELRRSLRDYHASPEGPGVLELRLGREQIPPFTPFLSHDAPTYEAAQNVAATVASAPDVAAAVPAALYEAAPNLAAPYLTDPHLADPFVPF